MNRKAAGRAPATINKEIQLLKHIVGKAIEWGKVYTNRIADVKPLKVPPGRVRYLELDEVPRLLEACPSWLRPIVLIAAHTGLRLSEITNLERSNVDKSNLLIVIDETKNGERKAVPMNHTVWATIRGLPTRLDTAYLFAEADGRQVDSKKVSVAFGRACTRAGIADFRFHDLRHHFASHLTMKGHNLKTVQELLGHKTVAMTVRYAHLSPEHLRRAVTDLDPDPAEKSVPNPAQNF